MDKSEQAKLKTIGIHTTSDGIITSIDSTVSTAAILAALQITKEIHIDVYNQLDNSALAYLEANKPTIIIDERHWQTGISTDIGVVGDALDIKIKMCAPPTATPYSMLNFNWLQPAFGKACIEIDSLYGKPITTHVCFYKTDKCTTPSISPCTIVAKENVLCNLSWENFSTTKAFLFDKIDLAGNFGRLEISANKATIKKLLIDNTLEKLHINIGSNANIEKEIKLSPNESITLQKGNHSMCIEKRN